MENASLVIKDVGKHDAGHYLCQAANNFGSLSSLIKLTVNGEYTSQQLTNLACLISRTQLDDQPTDQND